jgi:hypothetical protein
VVISNDSDLTEPIRLAGRKFGKPVMVLHPCGSGRKLSYELQKVASRSMKVDASLLPSCLFPATLTDAAGRTIHKPASWSPTARSANRKKAASCSCWRD